MRKVDLAARDIDFESATIMIQRHKTSGIKDRDDSHVSFFFKLASVGRLEQKGKRESKPWGSRTPILGYLVKVNAVRQPSTLLTILQIEEGSKRMKCC